MNRLESYAVNLFFTIEVSRTRVQKFIYDHIQRLTSANNPNFAQIIVDITALWEALFGNIETYDEVLNEQVSFSQQMNNKMREFTTKVVDLEPAVLVKFKKDNPVYKEFFPHGLTEYHNMTQDNAKVLMDRIVSKTHTYAADIGATWEPEFILIHDKFDLLFANQKQKKGEVKITVSQYNANIGPTYIQLFKNMALILAEYPQQPTRMLDFFDQTIVNFESHIHPLTIEANTKKASDLTFGVNDTVVITSKFDKVLKYFYAPTADSETILPLHDLEPMAKVSDKATVTGAPENKFVIFINETDSDANIEVRLE